MKQSRSSTSLFYYQTNSVEQKQQPDKNVSQIKYRLDLTPNERIKEDLETKISNNIKYDIKEKVN